MSKLTFYYSSMNAGKSTSLLQASYNYQERGMKSFLFCPNLDDRYGVGKITSRIGLEEAARIFSPDDNLYKIVAEDHLRGKIDCILIDEAQFLTKQHVFQLGEIVDKLNIPVLAYGLRTDFQGELFEGSKYLLAWADNIKEIIAICHCGRKATMVIRMGEDGQVITEGSQVEIGGNDRYVALCRKHFKKSFYND